MEYCFRLVWEAATASLVFILQQTSVHGRTTSCYKTGWKTQPGVLLHLRQGLLLDHSEMKEFLPGSPLSHLDYGSRNKDLFFGFWHVHCGYYYLNGTPALRSFIYVDVGEPTSHPCS